MDLQILAAELAPQLEGYRLSNIYNVATSARQFLLKFAVPDSKKVVVVDCGNKLHLTAFERPTLQTPSNFVTKLRKHLKTRRLSRVAQVGSDRVLVLEFSDGLYYLVLEFFSAGNILLLDSARKILSLQRMVQDKGNNDRYAVNETYNMFDETVFAPQPPYEARHYRPDEVQGWITRQRAARAPEGKKSKVFSIHKLLFVNASHLLGDLIRRRLARDAIDAARPCFEFDNPAALAALVRALDQTERDYLELLLKIDGGVEGYIVMKRHERAEAPPAPLAPQSSPDALSCDLDYLYDEFHPFEPQPKPNTKLLQISGYNATLDHFFTTIDSSKYALRIEQQKQQAGKRLAHARSERDRQIQALVDQQTSNIRKGDLIIMHADAVSVCQELVRKLVEQQMDWTNIESVIGLEQSRGNKVANMIRLPLNLIENKINILLPEDATESDSDSESESESDSDSDGDSDRDRDGDGERHRERNPRVSVWIDLALSPHANARIYYDAKKTAETKKLKVEKSATMALKNAERKINQDLQKNLKGETEVLRPIRPKFWFEKFHWFVSSEGYLCLAGKDDAQSDMLYYRHVNDNDSYVTSDEAGSLQVFIKNPFKGEGVPPSTLMQAGMFAMTTSAAWNNKVTTSAWVLKTDEVSKRDFDGTFLEAGRFRTLAKQRFLPPIQLVMGFGLYWLVREESAQRYRQLRIAKEQEHGLKIVMSNKKRDLEGLLAAKEEPQEPEAPREPEAEGSSETTPVPAPAPASAEAPSPVDDASLAVSGLNLKPTPAVRGKKGKAKKMAKYDAQDDEDKRLRMQVLGTLKQVEERQRQHELKVQEPERPTRHDASKKVSERQRQHEREIRKYLAEVGDGGDAEIGEDEVGISNYLEILDSFVSKPLADDELVDLVPVFAPWAAMLKFKYKAKVQPGMAKKGKLLNDILHYFTTRKLDPLREDADLDWAGERDIIKSTKPTDLIGVITVNKLKVVLPGGESGGGKKVPAIKRAAKKKN